MRVDENQGNEYVEDRRGQSGGGGFGGGGGRGPGIRLGLGGMIVVGVLSLVFKRNFFAVLGGNGGGGGSVGLSSPRQDPRSADERARAEEPLRKVAVGTFNSAQDAFRRTLPNYRPTTLVLFWDETRSGCGGAGSAMGPFYCPADEKVYIDLGFYHELDAKLGAPGDFAQAYVIAHEVGHHLQNVLGTEAEVRRKQRQGSKNELSVRMELQADCYAGVWGKMAADKRMLEAGDMEEALRAAAAIGDDRLQKMGSGRVRPESFTHGSSASRVRWLKRGLSTGKLSDCDTFSAAEL
jgi:uncharacterized protein